MKEALEAFPEKIIDNLWGRPFSTGKIEEIFWRNCGVLTWGIPGKMTGEALGELPGLILRGMFGGIPGGISGKYLNYCFW